MEEMIEIVIKGVSVRIKDSRDGWCCIFPYETLKAMLNDYMDNHQSASASLKNSAPTSSRMKLGNVDSGMNP